MYVDWECSRTPFAVMEFFQMPYPVARCKKEREMDCEERGCETGEKGVQKECKRGAKWAGAGVALVPRDFTTRPAIKLGNKHSLAGHVPKTGADFNGRIWNYEQPDRNSRYVAGFMGVG